MTMDHTAPHAAPAVVPFGPSEVDSFHQDDRHAAGVMIGLMLGIFVIGIILYSIVCYAIVS